MTIQELLLYIKENQTLTNLQMPYFSVIIPTHNRGKYIAKAINSLLDQTFADFELIIIDDASEDNTKEIVNNFNDNRIVYLKNGINQERCISRNLGIAGAKGKYICFLDSDDYHLPEHLAKLHEFIISKKEPVAFFFSNSWNKDENNTRTERCCPDFAQYNPYSYFLHYTVNPQRWAVHHQIFKKITFDPEVIICEDMDTSLRILSAGYPIFQIKERTTVYVQSHDSFTMSDANKAEKELFYLKKIFAKDELKGKLPLSERWRLLSMCYFHMAVKAFDKKERFKVLKYGIRSFLLFPKGYNGKTNKTLFVMCVYSFPIIGGLIKTIVRNLKK